MSSNNRLINCSQCRKSYNSISSLNRHMNQSHTSRDYSRGRSRSRSPVPYTRSCKECYFKDREIGLLKNEIEYLKSHNSQLMSLLETVLKSQSSTQIIETIPISQSTSSTVDFSFENDDSVDFDSLFPSSV